MVQLAAVRPVRQVVLLAEQADATARLHHQLLRYRHHDAEEVWIIKCLKQNQRVILIVVLFLIDYKTRGSWMDGRLEEGMDLVERIDGGNKKAIFTEVGRQKTDCSVTRRSVNSTSFFIPGKWSISMPTCRSIGTL